MTLHSFVADSHTVDHFRNKMTRTKAVYDESDVFQNCGRCIAVQQDVRVCKFFFSAAMTSCLFGYRLCVYISLFVCLFVSVCVCGCFSVYNASDCVG